MALAGVATLASIFRAAPIDQCSEPLVKLVALGHL